MTGRFQLSAPVREALAEGRPVVALETSVLAHGLPRPRAREAAEAMGTAVAARGAVAAWVGILGGSVHVGLDGRELDVFVEANGVAKVARRDVPMAVAAGAPGATTVSTTLWAAATAGVEVAATGGIGGVHAGAADVSSDLVELARVGGTLVCSGPKSIVDPVATLERLEELGVSLIGYRCARLPLFLVEQSELPLEHRADSPAAIASVVAVRRDLGISSTLLVCNPIPAERALPAPVVEEAVAHCLTEARRQGVRGKAVTPFLLRCLADRTAGMSLESNLALLASNAALAADVAGCVADLDPVRPRRGGAA
jgi:pseudouridine-5'-phosphate glycosidase